MAVIFRDGFDGYNTSTAGLNLGAKYSTAQGTSVAGRFGGSAIFFNGGATTFASMDSAVSSLTIHMGLNVQRYATTTTRPMIWLLNGVTHSFGLAIGTSGEIIAYRMTALTTGTELGRSAINTLALSTWYSIAAEIVISDASGRVTVYVDGVQVLNLTSVDTNNGVGTVDTFMFGQSNSTSPEVYIDDLVITDSATRLTNHPRIQTLVPTSDGGTLNLVPSTGTDHFAVVDELPASNTDYLSGSTVGDLDILGLGDLTASPNSIEEVNVVGFLQKTDATAREMELGVISGPTTSAGTGFVLNSTGKRHERPLATDPNTSAAWTASGVNALQLRPRVSV